MSGDLGAGKSVLVREILKIAGITNNVTSPTFTIMNEYQGEPLKLYHFDMYRLSSLEEAVSLGFEEYFDLKLLKGVVVVEWAENVEGLLPIKITEIEIQKVDDEKRNILIEYKGLVWNY